MGAALQDLLERHVAAGTVPGAVALLAGDEVTLVAAGLAEIGGAAIRTDAIFRIQSMTKPVTTVAALLLVQDKRIALDQGVEEWLPELTNRQVLVSPTAELSDTVPARRSITLRHLLTNGSGYGMALAGSPVQRAMADNGTEAGPEPPAFGAQEWLDRLADLPLTFQPGEGWRYHHSFALLGILLSRLTGRPLGEHLAEAVCRPLGMVDTGFWVPEPDLHRLPAAYRPGPEGLVETEPSGGGPHAGPPPFDVSHGELLSTASDFHRLARMLGGGGLVDGQPFLSADHLRQMTSDQVRAEHKTPDSFFPGFWDTMGWGFGVGVQLTEPGRGRYGWSGGQGTDFFVDPDGTIGILLTQVEMGWHVWPLVEEFQQLAPTTRP